MDPLSQLLSLLKPQSFASGGVVLGPAQAVQWPYHEGVKCYAVVSGACWLSVEGIQEPIKLRAGECYLLPPGPAFRLATDLSQPPVDFQTVRSALTSDIAAKAEADGGCFLVGGHFLLSGRPASMLLDSLPPVVHIHAPSDRTSIQHALAQMANEMRSPQPGSGLIVQHLAFMLLINALRLHADNPNGRQSGWLFALKDKQLSRALACMHDHPGERWRLETLAARIGMSRSQFARHFKETVGSTPIEYLTQWRMLLACDRIQHSGDSILHIALSLGYESESAFRKAFKRVIGCAPGKLGRAMR